MTRVPPAPTVTGARASVAGAVVSSLAAYAFTILGARILGDAAYAPVGVLWTVQYLVLTVGLLSLEAWITRDAVLPRVTWRWIGGLALALCLATAAAAPAMLGDGNAVWTITALGIGMGFGAFVVARGIAAAEDDLRTYGILTGGESVVRLLVALAVLALVPTGPAVSLTLPVGALVVAVVHLARHGTGIRATVPAVDRAGGIDGDPAMGVTGGPDGREDPIDGADDAPLGALPFLASTTTANAVLQLLLAGGPLLTAAVGAPPSLTSIVFVTTSAARAPLALVYSGLLTRLLRAVRRSPDAVVAARLRQAILLAPLAVGAGFLGGWAAGPPLVALAFGQALRPTALFAGLTGAAVVCAILLLAANQVLIARRASRRLWLPWTAALLGGSVLTAMTAGIVPDLRAGVVALGGMAVAGILLSAQLLRKPDTRVTAPVAAQDVL